MAIELNLYTSPDETTLPMYWEEGEQESRAYLYLDLEGDGEMWVGSKSPSNNSCGTREFSGIVRVYSIPNNLTEVGYNDLMQHPTVASLAKLIHEDSEVVWSGITGYRIEMGDDALEAEIALEAFCASIEPGDFQALEPVCASYYLQGNIVEEDNAEKIVEQAIRDGYYLSVVEVEKELNNRKEAE